MSLTTLNRRAATAAIAGGAFAFAGVRPASAQTKLRINYIPIFDVTPMFAAIDKGFFAEEGLVVEPTPSTGGAAGVPGLMAGAYDIMYGNVVSIFLATQQGFKLKVVAPGIKIFEDEMENAALAARKADGIKSGKDLEGKTLAVNNRNGVIWLYAHAWVKKSGGDPAKVTFKEVPFPQMVDALRAKQVDATFLVDPFLTNALNDPALELVVRPYRYVQPGVEVGQYLTTEEYFTKNQENVRKFYRAMVKGVDWYNKNRTSPEAFRIISGFTKLPLDVLAKQTLGTLPAKVDLAQLDKTQLLMKDAGLVKSTIDVKTIVDPAIVK